MAVLEKTDFSALRATTPHNFGDIAFVAKRLAADANTDGGGTFVYDTTVSTDDDNATIIKPNDVSGAGRWLRRVDVRGPVHAEWFGAKGDGVTDDTIAIRNALTLPLTAPYKRVTLLAKTYVLNSEPVIPEKGIIDLLAGYRVEGQGIDKTFVRVTYNPAAAPTSPTSLAAFGTSTTCDDAVVQDMTIDCGYNLVGDKHLTRNAVELVGQRVLIRRVKAIDFGVGTDASGGRKRATVVSVALSAAGVLGTIQECQVTQPGDSSSLSGGLFPELVCLQIKGFSAAILGIGGSIIGNRVFDVPYSSTTQKCPVWGIKYQRCQGSEIADNEVTSVDGAGIATDIGKAVDVVIRNNRLLNVNVGVALLAADTATSLEQQHTQIVGNTILLGKKNAVHPLYPLYGVYLNAVSGIPTSTIRFQDLYIERNFIRGTTITSYIPIGIFARFDSDIWQRLNILDNLIETKDKVSTQLNEDYENSIVFRPTALYQAKPSDLRLHGNRSLAPTSQLAPDLRVKLYDVATSKWGPFSNRLARFQSPVFDGRVGLMFDDFVAATSASGPQFALGWEIEVGSGGSVTSQAASTGGDVLNPGPGLVAISPNLTNGAYAALRYRESSVILSGAVGHVLEFYAKRSAASDGSNSWECLLGLFTSASAATPDGAYFKIDSSNNIVPLCRTGAETTLTAISDSTPSWRTYRIELLKSGSVIDMARFFINGDYKGKITTNIPTTAGLVCGFRTRTLSTNAVARKLYVDYFQHQLVPSN